MKKMKLSQRYVWTEKAERISKNAKAGEPANEKRPEWLEKRLIKHGLIKPVIMEVDKDEQEWRKGLGI